MPKNLRHTFRTELITQQKRAKSRDTYKTEKGHKADYYRIYSHRSYELHWKRAQSFANWLKEQTNVRSMDEISREIAIQYLIYQRDRGLSASTIGADALMINHLMVGSRRWKPEERIIKSQIADMPKRSYLERHNKLLTASEWRERNPEAYQKFQDEIDTIRAFGLRRRESFSVRSQAKSEGFGPKSVYRRSDGRLAAIVRGKGGKIRLAPVREDLSDRMEQLYGKFARPVRTDLLNPDIYRRVMGQNRPFYNDLPHSIPAHIFRAEYAQKRLQELDKQPYHGTRTVKNYVRDGHKPDGSWRWKQSTKTIKLADTWQVGAYKAQYGAFFELSKDLGHNRLDVLRHYLGVGR